MPQGDDTVVGERGFHLSGGQRQRIATARALLRNAPILLLDETTSALDSYAQLEIQRVLRAHFGGRTLLSVAHRLSTVMACDRDIALQNGIIVEDWPPSMLLEGTGWFVTTLRLQRGTTPSAWLRVGGPTVTG